MKKLIKKIAVKSLSIIEKPVKQTNWYKRISLDKENYPTNDWYRTHEDRNFDIVNVGSSSAVYAFDYSDTDLKAFNWALRPQSMEYSFKVLQNFYSILKSNGIVIIPLSPFSGLSIPKGEWSTDTVDRYFGILDPSLIEGYTQVANRRKHPFLNNPKLALKRLIRDIPTCPQLIQFIGEDEFRQDAQRWISNWMKEFGITDLKASLTETNNKGMAKRQTIMQNMIEFCHERFLKPVIVIPPVHPSLAEYFDANFRKTYISNFIEDLDLNDVLYIDWLTPDDCPFELNDTYFLNSFFLNDKGAKTFTSNLISHLKLEGLL